MTIETKYNIGDKVWYKTTFEEPKEYLIIGIIARIDCPHHIISYRINGRKIGTLHTVVESELSPTREELLKSL